MLFEYRKFGDSFYYVSEKHSYDPCTKTYKLDYIGTVRKIERVWIGKTTTGETVKAKTRKEAAEAMMQRLEKK